MWHRTGTPIQAIRGADRRIRAFYNTYRHRGMPVVQQDAGDTGRFPSFGYHGWTYDTTGALTAVPDPRDRVNLDASCRGLVSVCCEPLDNWIFVYEETDAPSFNDFADPVARYFRRLHLHHLRLVYQRTVEKRGNYEIVLENFLETDHVRLLFRYTTDPIFGNPGTSVRLWTHGHSLML